MAREVGYRYIENQVRLSWSLRRTYFRGWRCYWGATTPGSCDTGRGRQGVWVLNYKDPQYRRYYMPPPRLRYSEEFLGKALKRRFGGIWTNSYARDVKCRQISRLRQRCDASWVIGDLGMYVRSRVRLVPTAGKWGVAIVRGRATRFDEYCYWVTNPGNKKACVSYRRVGPARIGV